MTQLKGVDVSHWQTSTPSLSGLSFLFAKASQGTTKDAMYDEHIANARKAGLVVGAYCFNEGSESIAVQVAAFVTAAGDVDLYALDVEGETAFTVAQTTEFIDRFRAATGRKIGLYHSDSGFMSAGQDWNWVAKWGSVVPARAWAFWQYQGSPLDLDYFNGDLAALKALAGGTDMALTLIKGEDWEPTVTGTTSNGVLRHTPDRSEAFFVRLPAGTIIRTIGEVKDGGNDWRVTEYQGLPAYLLRSDWAPLVAGGDPAVDQGLTDYIARKTTDCTAAVKAATDPLLAKIAAGKAALA